MMIKNRKTVSKHKELTFLLISGFILIFLFMQAGETFRIFCPWKCAPSFWPFIDYPMYSAAHYAEDKINRIKVFGLLEDGTEILITYQDLSLDSPLKINWLILALQEDDKEVISVLMKAYHSKHNKKLIALRVENNPLVLVKEGTKSLPTEILLEVMLQDIEEQ